MNRWESNYGEYFALHPFYADNGYYVSRLLWRDTYFIWEVIIITAVFFFILIDNFNELRRKKSRNDKDRRNVCFICGDIRENMERKSMSFKHHLEETHNLWNYVNYMIGLQFMNMQETNAINSYVIDCIHNRSIIWFPSSDDSSGGSGTAHHH